MKTVIALLAIAVGLAACNATTNSGKLNSDSFYRGLSDRSGGGDASNPK